MNINKKLSDFLRRAFIVMIVIMVAYFAISFCKTAYDFGYRLFTEPAMEAEPGVDVLVQIKEGMTTREIGELFEDRGLVRDGNLFSLQIILSAYKDKMVPGVYTLNTSLDPKGLMMAVAEAAEAEKQETEATESTETTEQVKVGEDEGTAEDVEEEE